MLKRNKPQVVTYIIRNISTGPWFRASHYDVLGITPKATQGDIKSAYYKLSKVYHPDKSSDETSAKKFRAITEAYEVLGNIKLKKMYDKGLLVGKENVRSHMDYKPDPEPDDPTLKFYKSHSKRQVTPTMKGTTPLYDFDTWSKQHYGDLLRKSKYDKEFIRNKTEKAVEKHEANRQETIILVLFGFTCLFIVLVINGISDFDTDNIRKQNATKEQQLTDQLISTKPTKS